MGQGRTILQLGSDALLSDARATVLENAGYEVLVARSLPVALRHLRTRQVDLILICHSVEDLEVSIQEFRRNNRHAPIALVHVGGLTQPSRSAANVLIDGLRGPEHLLAQIGNIIGRRRRAAAS
ncbi:MAG: hypothetical protein ACR2IF_00590 [Terriglobales bacterium]